LAIDQTFSIWIFVHRAVELMQGLGYRAVSPRVVKHLTHCEMEVLEITMVEEVVEN
jgi:hypothetical protein